MKANRLQGQLFILVALFALLSSFVLPTIERQTELLLIFVAVLFIGVPHGALDPIFAKSLFNLKTPLAWAYFLLTYVFVSCLVVVLWWFSPFIFLFIFLSLSVFHFSGDLRPGAPWTIQLLYGGAPIVLPAALHQAELGYLFSILIGDSDGLALAKSLGLVAWPWFAAITLEAFRAFKKDGLSLLEVLSVVTIATVLSPLTSFAVFFCFMHSARHIARTKSYAGMTLNGLLKVALAPLLGVLALGCIAWVYLPSSSLSPRLVQFIFVGLAALTVPHMGLIERIRWAGWR
jgi:Brp/Blh family beta-carotene 15,15'-monooxygenase